MKKIYPDSGVELSPVISTFYDKIMDLLTLGKYKRFIIKAIADMQIQTTDDILDLGCGTGRNATLMRAYLEGGTILGLDISKQMEKQFNQKFKNDKQVTFLNQRIDQPFVLAKKYDKILISFVMHGLPNTARVALINNAVSHLKPDGELCMLDYAEFSLNAMPFFHKLIFKMIECKYAFDYLKRDWKDLYKNVGLTEFTETFYLKKYVRLLKTRNKPTSLL
ncbi:MAG: class I SAM-dependent methyltransferase [Salinivirgaceae bacterium]|nr:class I SAM-dependent methyltransferase [Salinivirgaceae bacterium]